MGLLLWGYALLKYVTQLQNHLITKSRIKTMVESAIHQPKLPADTEIEIKRPLSPETVHAAKEHYQRKTQTLGIS